VRSWLRCVKGCAAMAAPRHMPAIARTPHGADRPTTVAVLVAVQTARRRHNDPAALGGHEIAYEVVGELVARLGHGDFADRTSDRDPCTPVLFRLFIRG
jgi:hypothetical protein